MYKLLFRISYLKSALTQCSTDISNLVQFKEMLTEQGLKVDSIEVAVGNFEFNKNGQAETGQEEQKRGKRKFQTEDTVATGRIEEDQLAQHFMEGGESTVNYMA